MLTFWITGMDGWLDDVCVLLFRNSMYATNRIQSRHKRQAANGGGLPGFLKTSNVWNVHYSLCHSIIGANTKLQRKYPQWFCLRDFLYLFFITLLILNLSLTLTLRPGLFLSPVFCLSGWIQQYRRPDLSKEMLGSKVKREHPPWQITSHELCRGKLTNVDSSIQ